jgi:hypothetical protein
MANSFIRKSSRNVSTTPIRIGSYTVGANTSATVIGLSVANVSNTGIFANVYINDGSSNFFLAYNTPIPNGSTLVPIGGDQKVVLNTSDGIFAQTTGGNCDVIFSILEIS